MFAISSFVFLVAFRIAACSVQVPELTDCSGGQATNDVNIVKVTVTNATAGQTVTVDSVLEVIETGGENPQLQISLAKPKGVLLACVPHILPCTLALCGGTTEMEEELSKEWKGECPVQPGTYNARISFDVPPGLLTKIYFGDGNVVVTAKIVDGDTLYSCTRFSVTFEV